MYARRFMMCSIEWYMSVRVRPKAGVAVVPQSFFSLQGIRVSRKYEKLRSAIIMIIFLTVGSKGLNEEADHVMPDIAHLMAYINRYHSDAAYLSMLPNAISKKSK
jgi:hypothetical protein